MKANTITLREARRTISKIIASGDTVAIGRPYQEAKAFFVPIPPHDYWKPNQVRAAFKQARANFLKAWKDAQKEYRLEEVCTRWRSPACTRFAGRRRPRLRAPRRLRAIGAERPGYRRSP